MKLSELITVVLFVGGGASRGHGLCESYQYMYTLQPPKAVVCNPFLNGVLNLTCQVTGELLGGIHWYFRRPGTSIPILITDNSSSTTFITQSSNSNFSVNLVIKGLDQEDVGFYWCQGMVEDGDNHLLLSSSLEFQLLPENRYLEIPCPKKAVKNSRVLCATIMIADLPTPSSSTAYLEDKFTSIDVLTDFLVPMNISLSSLSSQANSLQPIQVASVSLSSTQVMVAVEPTVLLTEEPINIFPPQLPTSDPQINGLNLSDIILYAILALLGFLIFLVLSLSIVISILCCKKKRSDQGGKEAPYDQFSTQSEALQGTLTSKSLESFPVTPPPPPPYRLPNVIQTVNSDASSTSGVYDEIHTALSQYDGAHACMINIATHDYQEIPVVEQAEVSERNSPTHTESRENSAPTSCENNAAPRQSYENPYDLPDQLLQCSMDHSTNSQPVSPLVLTGASVTPSHKCGHKLHGKRNLSSSESQETESSVESSSDLSHSNVHLTQLIGDNPEIRDQSRPADTKDEIELQVEVELMNQESSAPPNNSKKENPYHTLEDDTSPPSDAQFLQNTYINLTGNEAASTPNTAAPLVFPPLKPPSEDGYDRLVGPPHIYHILQKSPSLLRPRVRECSPTSGYHHLDTRMDSGACSPHRFPLADDIIILQGEETSTNSSSEIFDDPQYTFSPKRVISVALSNLESHRNSTTGQFSTLERAKIERGIDLSKYRGDYERDPMYMKLIHRLKEVEKQSDAHEEADHLDISAFLRLPRSQSMSMPELGHTYQPLELTMREPSGDYEVMQKWESSVQNTIA